MGDPLPLRPGDRMGAHEASSPPGVALDPLDDPGLRAAGVGHEDRVGSGSGGVEDVADNPVDRRASDGDGGIGHAAGEVGLEGVDRAESPGLLQPGGVPADADHAFGQPPRTDGHSDRAADQAHADDRHRPWSFQDVRPPTARASTKITPAV